MALYSVSATNGQIISSTQGTAECLVTCIVPNGNPPSYQLSTVVTVALGTVAAMNTAIMNAAIAELQRVYGITPNQGSNDQKGLFGGRTI